MERVRKVLVGFSEVIEVVLAIGVAVLLVMDIIGLLPRIGAFWAVRGDAEEFSKLLSSVLGIVVGTEFIKMLIKPTFSNVTEVLVFLIARHVILSEATPTDNLISVISIAILFALEYFLSHEGADSSLMADVSKKFRSRRHSRSVGSREDSGSDSVN
jgi:hypothetical protein